MTEAIHGVESKAEKPRVKVTLFVPYRKTNEDGSDGGFEYKPMVDPNGEVAKVEIVDMSTDAFGNPTMMYESHGSRFTAYFSEGHWVKDHD